MKKLSRPISPLLGLLALLQPAPSRAYKFTHNLEVYGYLQSWLTLHEQLEDAKGLFQLHSHDEAASSVSGFRLSRARIGLKASLVNSLFQIKALVKLERDFALLDASVELQIKRWLRITLGQLKIPSAYENHIPASALDFIMRSRISDALGDYALSRTVHASSHFIGNRSYRRDFGLALKGALPLGKGQGEFRYFLMMGNGLGANLYISGTSARELILTNLPQFFFGGRLEFNGLFKILTVGGHYSYNQHDNMSFNSGRAVYDLKRMSASLDIRVRIPGTGLKLAGLYGWGAIHDDFDGDGQSDLNYSGWAAGFVWSFSRMLGRLGRPAFWKRHRLTLCFRYDRLSQEVNRSGIVLHDNTWTIGLGYSYRSWFKVQLNYGIRITDDPYNPDLGDNFLIVNFQGAI